MPRICIVFGTLALLVAAASASAQTSFSEVEPNNSKATASPAMSMQPGDFLTGTTTGASTAAGATSYDYFRVQMASAPPAIYRYQLVVTSDTPGHTISIMGLTQAAGVPTATEATFQTSVTTSNPPRMIQWYGFGQQEELYVRVSGTATTTSPYVATLVREEVTPVEMPGTIGVGSISVVPDPATSAAFDTDWWVYGPGYAAIPGFGHDDADTTAIARNLTPGDYYIAGGIYNSGNNLGSPTDDTFRTGAVLDFPNCYASNSTSTLTTDMSYMVSGPAGSAFGTGNRAGQYDVVWFHFVVEPSVNPTGSGTATPSGGLNDGTTTIHFAVSTVPGITPPSTGISVVMDLSSIGGSGSATMFDDGLHGDGAAHDNVFGLDFTIPNGTFAGTYSVYFTVSDAQGRSSQGQIDNINIVQAPIVTFDFGDLTPPTSASQTFDTFAGEIKWFTFNLSQPATAASGRFVDIDTEFSAGCTDTEIGLYRADGTLVANDDDSGSGGVGVSQLSFGAGGRPAATSCGTGGVAYNGRNGDLAAGTYFIAVGRFNVTFNATQFNATSTGTDAFGIQLNIRSQTDPTPPSGTGVAVPATAINDGNVNPTLRVTVIPGAFPASTGLTVHIDASAIGGSFDMLAFDNGLPPDVAAGDNIYSVAVNVPAGQFAGAYALPFTINDAEGRSGSGSINLTVADAIGGCCQSGGCSIMTRVDCLGVGGNFLGHNVPCISNVGYAINTNGGAFEDISFSGSLVSNTGDDTVFQAIPIGFAFPFFGTPYTELNISTNGNIQFAPSASTTYVNQPIPNAALPNNMIAVAWDDFNFNVNTVDDGLYTETRGTPGVDLRFIVQWTNVSQFGIAAPGDRNTFQAVLFEDGHIELRYLELGDLSFDSITGSPGATIGTENADGTDGTNYDYLSVFSGTSLRADVSSGTDNCVNACPIDFNGDGNVDADDLGDFINCYFSIPPCDGADFNADGDVNADDLGDFINAYFAGGC